MTTVFQECVHCIPIDYNTNISKMTTWPSVLNISFSQYYSPIPFCRDHSQNASPTLRHFLAWNISSFKWCRKIATRRKTGHITAKTGLKYRCISVGFKWWGNIKTHLNHHSDVIDKSLYAMIQSRLFLWRNLFTSFLRFRLVMRCIVCRRQ